MFWTVEKITARLKELAEYRYRDAIPIAYFEFQEDEEGAVGSRQPLGEYEQTLRVGEDWKGRDLYAWLSVEMDIPEHWGDRTVVGRFDFGKTGGGNNSGFESLLYVNGAPFQGVDANHQEVFFPAELSGSTISLCFRLWSGLEGGGAQKTNRHEIRRAEIGWLDEDADDLYFSGKAIAETVSILQEDHPDRAIILTVLDKSLRLIDWAKPGSEPFYDSVKQSREWLRNEMAKWDKRHPVTVKCIGHTHIDVAWLWRLKHTREKSARSFSTVLRLMEKYPEYVFLQTQPQLYAYIKSDYPEIYQQMADRIQEGRWEAGGGMWLEADCNLTSGESLVRQILMGTRFLRSEFGAACTYLWLPDVFGYSWALPQILKKAGIDTFMTTKISWNQYNRMPHDTFYWRGIDGTEVLTHFITTPEVDNPEMWWYTYNGSITPTTVQGIWKAYQDKTVNQELLLSYGYGDGGGGVNREMLEMRRRLNEIPGLPNVVTGRADEYFHDLHRSVQESDQYVHTWDGELYLEYHRGTYTSQAYNKRMNRKLELLYRETEWIAIMAYLRQKADYPQNELNEGWKIILRNQFHDIIPGSSIREVYEDSRMEYEEAWQKAERIWHGAASSLAARAASNRAYTLFNSAPWRRRDLVLLPAITEAESGIWADSDQRTLKAQRINEGWLVEIEDLPPMGYVGVQFVPMEPKAVSEQKIPFTVLDHGITTPYYSMEWNEQGQLVKLFDRQSNRQVLPEGERGNVLQVFEDKPKMFDAWDIDLFYQEKMREVVDLIDVRIVERNELRAVVRFEWRYMDSWIRQDMIVYASSRRIDFVTKADWHERQQLLKVAFPVEVRSTEATYDIQFGNVKRPTHWNTSWDYARFETVGQQWADLSEQGYGVSLLNDCKYGYDIKDHIIRLSLIKSAIYPDVEADQGHHEFTYALLPHAGGWLEGNTVREAWQLNNPLTFTSGQPIQSMFSLFHTTADSIMIDAVKKAEDSQSIVLRLHEFHGSRGTAEIRSDLKIRAWQECDLLEQPIEAVNEGAFQFSIKPYEIKTFLIQF
jgi:alpha-mannosidase